MSFCHLQVTRFTSEHKEMFTTDAAVCVTTYTMIAFSGRRSEEAQRVNLSCFYIVVFSVSAWHAKRTTTNFTMAFVGRR